MLKRRPTDRYLPAVYIAVPLAVVAFVLPSTLRPPPDSTQSGAQYSPDAPPNAHAQTIVKTVAQPGSATAGQPTAGAGPSASPVPRPHRRSPEVASPPSLPSRYGCAPGRPPLQWPSVYAVPCQAAFTGDNGGATGVGVTATSINVVMSFYAQNENDGAITDVTAQTSAKLRTLNDLQKYFNAHAELYNRKIRMYWAKESGYGASESDKRANADAAIANYHPLAAMVEGTPPEIDEFSKHHVVSDQFEQMAEGPLKRGAPYAWGQNSPTVDAYLAAEWICKQIKGDPPIAGVKTGNPTFDPRRPRTFSTLNFDDPDYSSEKELTSSLKTCGINPLNQRLKLADGAATTNAILRLKQENISTVILNTNIVDEILFMNAADSNGYYPEWLLTGYGTLLDDPPLVRAVDSSQLAHLFGLFQGEVALSPQTTECLRAVASVDAGYAGQIITCHLYWEMLSHLVDAIQLNGPKLDARSLAATYPTVPSLTPTAKNSWALMGSFDDPTRRSWANAATIAWWDANALDQDGKAGTVAYGECGHRYLAGQFPTRKARIFTTSGYVTGLTFGRCPGGHPSRTAPQARASADALWLLPVVAARSAVRDRRRHNRRSARVVEQPRGAWRCPAGQPGLGQAGSQAPELRSTPATCGSISSGG